MEHPTTETSIDSERDSEIPLPKGASEIKAIFGFEGLCVYCLRNMPNHSDPFRSFKQSSSEQSDLEFDLNNSLNGTMRWYAYTRFFNRPEMVGFKYTVVLVDNLEDPESNARMNADDNFPKIFINMSRCPKGEGGKHSSIWILSRICHEITEYTVMRSLRFLEISVSEGEAKKVVRDIINRFYPEHSLVRNFQ